MNPEQLRTLLTAVAQGRTPVGDALERLRAMPFEDVGFATVDHHRQLRCGHPEVIFAQGKTVEQVVAIANRLAAGGACVLATRTSEEQRIALQAGFPTAELNALGRTVFIPNPTSPPKPADQPSTQGPYVAVVCAGTSDLPVAEEAATTLRAMGTPTIRVNDVGVSGLHRLLPHVERLQRACAVVVIAGMEGALPSVVGGLVACPVFAVPTSVGYGSSMGGMVALLAMLNSCASNISVVNIDNGFGAAYSAGLVYSGVDRASRQAAKPENR